MVIEIHVKTLKSFKLTLLSSIDFQQYDFVKVDEEFLTS